MQHPSVPCSFAYADAAMLAFVSHLQYTQVSSGCFIIASMRGTIKSAVTAEDVGYARRNEGIAEEFGTGELPVVTCDYDFLLLPSIHPLVILVYVSEKQNGLGPLLPVAQLVV